MKVLLLAAGRGTRISRYLGGDPKCTVDIGGIRLIQYTIDMLERKGIREIAMVLGYNAARIREVLAGHDIRYFYNPFFDVTNSIGSAWFAKDFLTDSDDICIMNADGSRKENADYKFRYHDGILEKYGKELQGDDITGEYVGIGRFSRDFVPVLVSEMDRMIGNQEHSVWWENILYSMVGTEQPVYGEEIDGLFWAEVDYIEDYQRILAFRGYTSDGMSNIRPLNG